MWLKLCNFNHFQNLANLEILPLFLAPARPMKELWKIRPYFGVFPLVLRALAIQKLKIIDNNNIQTAKYRLAKDDPVAQLMCMFDYLNRAFSAPRIWTVLAGHLAKLVKLPACEIRRAPTVSPMRTWS